MQSAYQYITNPTTRLIYNAFGHSGLEVYEASIEDFEELEKQHSHAIEANEDKEEIEQLIFNKTVLLISETMRQRIHSEYEVMTSFELGIDLEKFCNLYADYKKHNRDDVYQLIEYRQAVMSSSFKIPIADWISGEVTVNSQTDMRKSLGISSLSYENTMSFPNDWELSNTLNIRPSGNSIDTELYKGLFDNKIGLRASITYDADGFSLPSLSASSGLSTTVGGYNIGFNTKISDDSVSVTPHIGFKLQEDITFSASTGVTFKENLISMNSNIGLTYHLSNSSNVGLFFTTNTSNFHLKVTCMIVNLGVYGYHFKFPFFLGTNNPPPNLTGSNTSSLWLSAGIVAAANIIAYIAFKQYKKIKKGKKYTSLDVDFRKFQEKYTQFKEKESEIIRSLDYRLYGELGWGSVLNLY